MVNSGTVNRQPSRSLAAGLGLLLASFLMSGAMAWGQAPSSLSGELINGFQARTANALRAGFTYSPRYPIEGQAVQFFDASTGAVSGWQWDFGDGATSTDRNPVHVYTSAGFRKITLVAGNGTISKRASRTLVVMPSPAPATFVFSPTSPGPGQAVQFTDTTAGGAVAWQWTFGDGATSAVKNPSHAYAAAGSYLVTLVARGRNWTKQASQTVTVANPQTLTSSFSYAPAFPTAGQAVQFTDTSAGTPTAWAWSFGDGGTSTAQNPSHTYTTAGARTVTLTVTDAARTATTTRTVTVAAALAASFTFTPASPAAGQSVQFTDTSTGAPTAWAWSFGDGGTSTAQNPSHTYTTAGTRTVTLTVTNMAGTATTSRTVTVAAALTASFTFTPASPAAGQAVQFTDTSTGAPTAWAWNFGDGGTSTAQNPSHAYTTAGTRTVTLTVTSGAGTASTTRTVTVAAALAASFTFTPASPAAGQSVQFTDTSTGTPTAWSWNFGDGATSTSRNPSHAYTTAGTRTVTLTVTSGAGTASTTRTVTVAAPVAASFTFTPASPAAGQAVQFTDTSTGAPTAWSWTFNDGGTSTSRNPSHVFASNGTYSVTLTASNAASSNSVTQVVTVVTSPTLAASFTYSPASPRAGQAVAFTDTSTGSPTSWSWSFGDGSTSTAQNPGHTYSAAGSMTVTLTVSNGTGSQSASRTVAVAAATSAIIVDHTSTRLSAIPQTWITQAKAMLHIAYGHTSHGSQVTSGMTGLVGFAGAQYGYNTGGTGGALDLRDYYGDFGYLGVAADLGNPSRTAWASATRTYLARNPGINVIIWSWCGQVDGTQAEIQQYLDLMSGLERDFPNVKFVYMTGHTDGAPLSGNVPTRNKQIRDYCIANNKILYDFADIESYDPDGAYFGDKRVTDSCDYDSNGDGAQDRNWAVDWQNAHPGEWYNCDSQHSQPLNANRKAYAAWYLWARLAGWDGN